MNIDFINSFRGYISTGNFLLDLNPFSKLNLLLIMPLFATLLPGWIPAVCTLLLLFVIALAGDCFKAFAQIYFKVGSLLFGMLFLMRLLFYPGQTVLLRWGRIMITSEGIVTGVRFGLIVTSICGAVLLFYKITKPKDLMYSIEKLGAPHETTYIILAAFQSIIDLGQSAQAIMESQSARGIETTGSLITRFKAFVPILGPLFLGAISATEEKAIAMETRAFSAPVQCTHLYELRVTPTWEKAMVAAFNILLVIVIVWRIVS